MDVLSLIGTDRLHESYVTVTRVYGADFERKMAELCLVINTLQEDSQHFNEAAFLMLITDTDEDFTPEEHERFNHEIRSAILWNMLERPVMVKEIENLKKVLGDVR